MMTRPQAAALPLSIGAHGAALAAVVALSMLPADLPEVRAAASTPTTVEVRRLPVVRPPMPLPATPRHRAIRPRSVRASTSAARPFAPAFPREVATPVFDAPLVGPAGDLEVECVGCQIGQPHAAPAQQGDEGEPGGGGRPVRIGGLIREPRKLRQVTPVYPEIARAARVQGSVLLDCTLTPEGRVSDVRVVSGHPLLVPAAASAVGRWLFTPTLLNGVPVPVILTVTVRFELK
jgi:protein TonB